MDQKPFPVTSRVVRWYSVDTPPAREGRYVVMTSHYNGNEMEMLLWRDESWWYQYVQGGKVYARPYQSVLYWAEVDLPLTDKQMGLYHRIMKKAGA